MRTSIGILNLAALAVVTLLIYFNTVDIENMQLRLRVVEVRLDDVKLHSKNPCLTIPDSAKCWDKTVFFKLPGGSLRKELRRICAWKSPKAQVWK